MLYGYCENCEITFQFINVTNHDQRQSSDSTNLVAAGEGGRKKKKKKVAPDLET
jgi:hypothetical protein